MCHSPRLVCAWREPMPVESVWRGMRPSPTAGHRSPATQWRSVAAAAQRAGRQVRASTAPVNQPIWPVCPRTTCTSCASSARIWPASAKSRANSANPCWPRSHSVRFKLNPSPFVSFSVFALNIKWFRRREPSPSMVFTFPPVCLELRWGRSFTVTPLLFGNLILDRLT